MNEQAPTLTFAGGAGTVTGSKYLLEAGGRRLLLDCGLFQGLKPLRLRNWADPPFDPRTVDAVVLSHGHLDHSGYLPLLVRNGFSGPVFCTPGTADLVEVVLRDAAHVQESEAARANRYNYSKHHPALPLYTLEDAQRALANLTRIPYDTTFSAADMTIKFRRAGHILGSSSVEVNIGGREPVRLVFSGDLGRWDRPIIRDPELVPDADVLMVESTYGDRIHPRDAEQRLIEIITETAHRGGALLVPAFAIGRTQELLWTIRKLEDAGKLPMISVFLDSPMGIDVTAIYCRHPEDHDLDMKTLMDEKRCPLCSRQYNLVRTVDESKALNDRRGPLVIIAGSGMLTGGRMLHHLKYRLADHRNTVLLVGYQAAGTRGRALLNGAPAIKIHGQFIGVRARVESLDGMSAHADQREILRWLRGFRRPPRQTYIVHGEERPALTLADVIRTELGWNVAVAVDGATVPLTAAGERP